MNFWKASTVLLTLSLVCVIGRGAINTAQAEPQPHMVAALNHLERAKSALQAATLDRGGHRLRAIELTEDAMGQIRKLIDQNSER